MKAKRHPDVLYNIDLSAREFDTVLAALRTWQAALVMHAASPQALAIATEHGPEMTPGEIDTLCERLNGESSSNTSHTT